MAKRTKKVAAYSAEEEARRSEIRKKIDEMYSYYADTYQYVQTQLKYAAGDQWDEGVAAERKRQGMPTVTVPILHSYITRIVNDFRKNPIGMGVEYEDEDIADILNGMLRAVEQDSRAEEVYENSHQHQVAGGLGWVRVGLEYADDETTDLVIKVYKVTDPGTCWIDPFHTLPDGSDARYGAHVSYISKEEAEVYGEDYNTAACDVDIYGEALFEMPDDAVAEVIFYELVETAVDRHFLADGSYVDELTGEEDVKVSRKIKQKSCRVTKIVGQKIVEEVDLPIPYILLVPVKGNELPLDDKRVVGMTHWAKSSQDAVNIYTNTELQLVANAPKNPIIMAEGQDEGHPEWDDFNTKNYSKLKYKPTTYDDGSPVPAPQRMNNSADISFAIQGRTAAVETMGRSLGIFDAMLGEMQYAGESGAATSNRVMQGQIGSLHYIQNLSHSIEQVCRLVLHLIPYAYTTFREIAVYDENGEKQKIRANISDIITPKMIKDVGFTVTSGPMIKSTEEENINSIMRIAQLMPESVGIMGDLIAETMGGAVSEQLAARLRKTLPPELQDDGNTEIDPQTQAMMQQADAQIQQLTQQNEYLEGVVRQLQAQSIADHEKNKTDIIQTVIKEEGAMARERLKQDGLNERQQEDIEAEASKDMMRYAEQVLSEDVGTVSEAMAPGSEDYVPQVAGPVADQPEFIEFDDEDTLTFEA
jgi:hypothetical protein